MMRTLVFLLALGLMTLSPAFAGGGDLCSDEATATVGDLHVFVGEAAELWQEQNGFPGLQRGACADENGRNVASDLQIA